jgi:NADH:ubiquinone oxidoreductase subunit E
MTTAQTKDKTTTPLDPQKLAELKAFIGTLKTQEHPDSHVISALHKTQEIFGFIPTAAMDEIALEMGIPTAHIWGVATFYHYFKLTRPGAHVISVCLGTACYVKGASQILQAVKDELKIDFGGVTEDGLFSLEEARCLGACGLAPVVMIDDRIYGELTPKKVVQILNQYKKEAKSKK